MSVCVSACVSKRVFCSGGVRGGLGCALFIFLVTLLYGCCFFLLLFGWNYQWSSIYLKHLIVKNGYSGDI